VQVDGWTDRQMNGRKDRQTSKQTGGQADEPDVPSDGQTDRQTGMIGFMIQIYM
jgi:hypothetical protein